MLIINNKYYNEESVFKPENLLREAKRQKSLPAGDIPSICLLDPDGDILEYLQRTGKTTLSKSWACYHTRLYVFKLEEFELGIIACAVGASFAVLIAEQLFVSGCKLLISITSAGIINKPDTKKKFALITSAVRDEGTSYHYLPPEKPALLNDQLARLLNSNSSNKNLPFFTAASWTTDAPYRETQSSIDAMKKTNITCVEMEASALYALSEVKNYSIICFAHLTNSMAQTEGDFEKGEESGSLDTLNLVSYVLAILHSQRNILK